MKKLVAMAMGAIMAIGFAGTVMLNPEPVCAGEYDVIILDEEFVDGDAVVIDDQTVEADGITYMANGGYIENEDGVNTVTGDQRIFISWNTQADGDGDVYGPGEVIEASEAQEIGTLYADWDIEEDVYAEEDDEEAYATEDETDEDTSDEADVEDSESGDIAIDNDTTTIGGDNDSNNSYDSHDVVTADSNNSSNSNNSYYADNSTKTNNTSYNTTNKIFNDNRIFKKQEDPKGPGYDEVITTADNYVDEPYTDGKYNEVKTGDHNFIFLIGAIAVAMMAAIGGIVALATGGKQKSQKHSM